MAHESKIPDFLFYSERWSVHPYGGQHGLPWTVYVRRPDGDMSQHVATLDKSAEAHEKAIMIAAAPTMHAALLAAIRDEEFFRLHINTREYIKRALDDAEGR